MSQFDELFESYKAEAADLGISVDEDLLQKVAKGLGPSIYNTDASLVSATDEDELATVKKNFLIGKLGLSDGPKLDDGIAAVMEQLKGVRQKKRVIVYYLLVKHFGKEDVYS